jgi:putative methyltransferase (TIGR04325 family)
VKSFSTKLFRRTKRVLRKTLERCGVIPVAAAEIRPQIREEPAEWEKISTWPEKHESAVQGWLDPSVSDTQLRRWDHYLRLIDGPGPLGVSHESESVQERENTWAHNLLMSYGYVLGRVAGKASSVSMLDWGCGAGHYLPISRVLYPDLQFQYTGFDLPNLSRIAQQLQPDAKFVESAELALQDSYDLVLAGSSLWYSEDWKECLQQLASATVSWIYITRMIFVNDSPSFVAVQRPWKYGYHTEYACWILNRQEFINECARNHLILEREFVFGDGPTIKNCGETGKFRGFLFRQR